MKPLHNSLMEKDSAYRSYCKTGKDTLHPQLGISYRKVYEIITNPYFQRLEKDDYPTRTKKLVNHSLENKINGHKMSIVVELLRFKKQHFHNKQIMSPIKHSYFYDDILPPLLKWPGGKTEDIKYIRSMYSELLPLTINNYYEPFVGGMAVGLMINSKNLYVNDICKDLIHFYEYIAEQNVSFFGVIELMTDSWDILTKYANFRYKDIYTSSEENLPSFIDEFRDDLKDNYFAPSFFDENLKILTDVFVSKIKTIHRMEEKRGKLPVSDVYMNVEGALKAGLYTCVRHVYNSYKREDALRTACFYFLRQYAYSSMFRYNSNGEFNVPYGGVSYNENFPNDRINYWKDSNLIKHLKKIHFESKDFLEFLKKHKIEKDDFIFVDPPYDSKFSEYDKSPFGKIEQEALAHYLVHECKANFMAIMKSTPLIRSLYEGKSSSIKCHYFDKNYAVSFMDRNDKAVNHIIVTKIN